MSWEHWINEMEYGNLTPECCREYFQRFKSRNSFYVHVKVKACRYLKKYFHLSHHEISRIVYNKEYDGSIDHALYHYTTDKLIENHCSDWHYWILEGIYPKIYRRKMVDSETGRVFTQIEPDLVTKEYLLKTV